MNECILEVDKYCTECGKCDLCDLDKTKICDNCCRCLGEAEYVGVEITEIILPDEMKLKRRKKG